MVPSKCRPGRGSRAAPGPVGATVRAAAAAAARGDRVVRGGGGFSSVRDRRAPPVTARCAWTCECDSGLFPAVAQRRSSARCRVQLLLLCWMCRPWKFNKPAVSMHVLG